MDPLKVGASVLVVAEEDKNQEIRNMGPGFNMENCSVVDIKDDQVTAWTVRDVRPGPLSSDSQEVNRRFQFQTSKN